MNKFKLRPAYRSKELLIEFTSGPEKHNFLSVLEAALSPIKAVITNSKDLWMNDEILYEVNSNLGIYQISMDNWGFAFIMSEDNQKLIREIDSILNENPAFEKEKVNFKEYELKSDE